MKCSYMAIAPINAFLGAQSSLPARPPIHQPNRRLSRFSFSLQIPQSPTRFAANTCAVAFIQSLPDNGKLSIKTTRNTDGIAE